MRPTQQSQGQGYTHSDSDGSFENDDGTPHPRRGISGQVGGSDRGAGAYSRRRLDAGSGSRRPRRRHRAATGHRAEDLKTYDPKAIGECLVRCHRVHSLVVLVKDGCMLPGTNGVISECGSNPLHLCNPLALPIDTRDGFYRFCIAWCSRAFCSFQVGHRTERGRTLTKRMLPPSSSPSVFPSDSPCSLLSCPRGLTRSL